MYQIKKNWIDKESSDQVPRYDPASLIETVKVVGNFDKRGANNRDLDVDKVRA